MQALTSLSQLEVCNRIWTERAAVQTKSGFVSDSDLRDGGRDRPNYMVVKGMYFRVCRRLTHWVCDCLRLVRIADITCWELEGQLCWES